VRALLLALLLMLAEDAGAATLADKPCPFAVPVTTHRAVCSRFSRDDDGARITFDVAVLTPSSRRSLGHVVYIPGGPGEAPVSEDGLFDDLLFPFADRTIVLFNPRGTMGTTPKMTCDFGATIWDEDFGGAEAQAILRDCLARFDRDGPDPGRFTSLEIAEDIDALIGALGVVRAGIYGISYGTEAGLHLIAQAPPWLAYAILDSVSVPGVSGIVDEMNARDRFLSSLDQRCFQRQQCSALVRAGADSLTEWAAQFDAEPLEIYLRDGAQWSFDGLDILDYLAQLGSYRDGLDLARTLISLLQTGRLRALGWMSADIAMQTDFAARNLPLLLEAYADTYDPGHIDTIRTPTQYEGDVQSAVLQLKLYDLWHGNRPREADFLAGGREEARMPVLMLSGGVDPFTPVEWAQALHERFTGVQHYVFPSLGHAVSVTTGGPSPDPLMADQTRCAGDAIRAFLNPTITPDFHCSTSYRTGDAE